MGCHFLLQGIFPTQGLNPGLPHCKQTLYCLSHSLPGFSVHGILQERSGLPTLLHGIFPTQGLNLGLLRCRQTLYHLSHKGSSYLSGWTFPFPGDHPNPGIKSRSPTLQADSLPAELQGKPHPEAHLFENHCMTNCFITSYCNYYFTFSKYPPHFYVSNHGIQNWSFGKTFIKIFKLRQDLKLLHTC